MANLSTLDPPLQTATLWAILHDTLDDSTANRLVWHCLGYRYDATTGWEATAVAADWRQVYPEPPNFIESRPATVKLTRSIPAENKQLLKEKLGFKGYGVDELIPRKTRRATIVNWLLSYMQQHDIPIESSPIESSPIKPAPIEPPAHGE
jgi:Domain of unknown function (DUF1823)